MSRECVVPFDYFSVAPELRFKQHERAKSFTGFIATLITGGILLYFLIAILLQIVRKESPSSTVSELFISDPPRYHLKDFTMAFTLASESEVLQALTMGKDYIIYATKVQWKFITIDGKRSINITTDEIEIKKCDEKYFGSLLDEFKAIANIEDLYCIPRDNPHLYIEGRLGAESLTQVVVGFAPCIGLPSCDPEPVVTEKLQAAMVIMYYGDTYIDLNQYDNPIKILRTGIIDIFNIDVRHEIHFSLSPYVVESDKGWLLNDKEILQGIKISEKVPLINTNTTQRGYNFLLKLSDKKIVYTRTYKKIQDGLAEIMGIGSTIALICSICIAPYVKLKYDESLVNSVYAQEPKFQKAKISFLDFVKAKLLNRKKEKEKLEYLEDRVKQVNKKLDISRIVYNMLTVEKMRALLLNKNQEIIFDHIVESQEAQTRNFELIKDESVFEAIEAITRQGKQDNIDASLLSIVEKA
jgi:hypothetical protein